MQTLVPGRKRVNHLDPGNWPDLADPRTFRPNTEQARRGSEWDWPLFFDRLVPRRTGIAAKFASRAVALRAVSAEMSRPVVSGR